MKVMQEEIFGPLLPVIPYERTGRRPGLRQPAPATAGCYFGYDKAQQQRVYCQRPTPGGVCLNDTLLHVAGTTSRSVSVPSRHGPLPWPEGFLTFSKAKGRVQQAALQPRR